MTEPVPYIPVPAHNAGAARGVRWWTDSVNWLFGDVSRLGVWVGMSMCLMLILIVLQWIPFFGGVAAHLLWFLFCGGLMLAAQSSERGRTPRFADLFSGFGAQGGALLGAGLIVLVASVAVLGVMLAVGLGTVVGAILGSASVASLDVPSLAAMSLGWVSALVLLLCLFLFVPITMAAWLAPALIALRGANAVDALRMSLAACRANLGALTVYGLVWIGLAVMASITLMIGWIFLVPLTLLSTYAAFRDLFPVAVEVEDIPATTPR